MDSDRSWFTPVHLERLALTDWISMDQHDGSPIVIFEFSTKQEFIRTETDGDDTTFSLGIIPEQLDKMILALQYARREAKRISPESIEE